MVLVINGSESTTVLLLTDGLVFWDGRQRLHKRGRGMNIRQVVKFTSEEINCTS